MAMLDGRKYIFNMFGWEGALLDGKGQGVYSFAGMNDVIKAMTQQSTEFIDQIVDIKQRGLRVNQRQLDDIFTGWVEQDANIKIHKLKTVENPESKLENEFQVFFLLCQSVQMVLAEATLGQVTSEATNLCLLPGDTFQDRLKDLTDGLAYLMSAKDEEVGPLIEVYTQKARDIFKVWRDSGEKQELLPQIFRYALFVWCLRRRNSEV